MAELINVIATIRSEKEPFGYVPMILTQQSKNVYHGTLLDYSNTTLWTVIEMNGIYLRGRECTKESLYSENVITGLQGVAERFPEFLHRKQYVSKADIQFCIKTGHSVGELVNKRTGIMNSLILNPELSLKMENGPYGSTYLIEREFEAITALSELRNGNSIQVIHVLTLCKHFAISIPDQVYYALRTEPLNNPISILGGNFNVGTSIDVTGDIIHFLNEVAIMHTSY